MNPEEFYKITNSAGIGTSLFLIAGALVIIAYVMASRMSKKRH